MIGLFAIIARYGTIIRYYCIYYCTYYGTISRYYSFRLLEIAIIGNTKMIAPRFADGRQGAVPVSRASPENSGLGKRHHLASEC